MLYYLIASMFKRSSTSLKLKFFKATNCKEKYNSCWDLKNGVKWAERWTVFFGFTPCTILYTEIIIFCVRALSSKIMRERWMI